MANGLSGSSLPTPRLVRRAHVGELREQVFVRPDLILGYLSVAKERKEEIHDVVGECPAIGWVDCRRCGVIREDIREQGPCDPPEAEIKSRTMRCLAPWGGWPRWPYGICGIGLLRLEEGVARRARIGRIQKEFRIGGCIQTLPGIWGAGVGTNIYITHITNQ